MAFGKNRFDFIAAERRIWGILIKMRGISSVLGAEEGSQQLFRKSVEKVLCPHFLLNFVGYALHFENFFPNYEL